MNDREAKKHAAVMRLDDTGMIAAFETHVGITGAWIDPEWRDETRYWAASWFASRAALDAPQAEPVPANATEPMQKAMQRAAMLRKSMNDVWRAAVSEMGAPPATDAQEVLRLASLVDRLRFALDDGDRKLTDSQLCRRAHEMSVKAALWDEWGEAQGRIENEMPAGWAFMIQCSPGDWDVYLTDPDGEHIAYDRDSYTLAQQMSAAVDEARAAHTAQEASKP